MEAHLFESTILPHNFSNELPTQIWRTRGLLFQASAYLPGTIELSACNKPSRGCPICHPTSNCSLNNKNMSFRGYELKPTKPQALCDEKAVLCIPIRRRLKLTPVNVKQFETYLDHHHLGLYPDYPTYFLVFYL